MSQERAAMLSAGAFVLCAAFILILFAWVDIHPMFTIGPLIAVAIACVAAYRTARDDDA